MPTPSDCLHIPTVMETVRHIKVHVSQLLQNNRRKGSELLSSFDFIYFLLDLAASRVCKEATVSQCAGAELSSSGGYSHNLFSK